MKRFYILSAVMLFAIVALRAEIPSNYYSSAVGLTDGELKTALYKIIYNHTEVKSYSALPEYFRTTDRYPDTNYWWDMYSDNQVSIYQEFGKEMNREHCLPKSWWGGSSSTPAYVDLFHLYPSNAKANSAKSNYPLGEVANATFDNGVVKVGTYTTGQGGGAAKVFEPADMYKGDFARTYFYMVTCYQNLTWSYTYMLDQNLYPTLKSWAIDLLLKWHRDDPVSQKELDRNEAVYGFQGNRNPFIDYPELAEHLWGNKMGQPFQGGTPDLGGEPELTTPVQGMVVNFEPVAIGKSTTHLLAFSGSNLKSKLSLVITGTDKSAFSIESNTLDASAVNAAGGCFLRITYTPAEIGIHTAKLIVSDGGMDGSRGVELNGECFDVPSLSTIVATAASDITETSYTANWETPSEAIDYYIVTRTRYINGDASSEEIIAEENYLVVEGFEGSTSESYNVRSSRLGYESPVSNEIFVNHAGVNGVEVEAPLGWAPWPGGVRIVCGTTCTNLSVYDVAGRLVKVVPEVANDGIVELPLGVYFITTAETRTPLRVIVN